jgi:hypothetical protein
LRKPFNVFAPHTTLVRSPPAIIAGLQTPASRDERTFERNRPITSALIILDDGYRGMPYTRAQSRVFDIHIAEYLFIFVRDWPIRNNWNSKSLYPKIMMLSKYKRNNPHRTTQTATP